MTDIITICPRMPGGPVLPCGPGEPSGPAEPCGPEVPGDPYEDIPMVSHIHQAEDTMLNKIFVCLLQLLTVGPLVPPEPSVPTAPYISTKEKILTFTCSFFHCEDT